MGFLNAFMEKLGRTGQTLKGRTREGVEFVRLSSESHSVSGELSALYEKIGRIYVESDGKDTQALSPLCARAEELRLRLEELEQLRLEKKNKQRCPACGAGMPRSARFCSGCGRPLSEDKETEEETLFVRPVITRPVVVPTEDVTFEESEAE